MAPKSGLKQATLSFASTKRTASASNTKGKQSSRVVSNSKRAASVDSLSISTTPSRSDEESVEVDEIEDADGSDAPPPLKKLRIDDRKSREKDTGRGLAAGMLKSRDGAENAGSSSVVASKENLDMMDKEGKLRKHYGVIREKMGNLKPSGCHSNWTRLHSLNSSAHSPI
jgi:DNA polymerase delta subunit 4